MCPFNSVLWPVIYNIGWSCTLKHCAVLENIHTFPTAGIWMGNPWIYTSYISVVTIQPVIILMRLHKQKQCMMVHFQCRFHASDFKLGSITSHCSGNEGRPDTRERWKSSLISSRFFVNFFFIQKVKKLKTFLVFGHDILP